MDNNKFKGRFSEGLTETIIAEIKNAYFEDFEKKGELNEAQENWQKLLDHNLGKEALSINYWPQKTQLDRMHYASKGIVNESELPQSYLPKFNIEKGCADVDNEMLQFYNALGESNTIASRAIFSWCKKQYYAIKENQKR